MWDFTVGHHIGITPPGWCTDPPKAAALLTFSSPVQQVFLLLLDFRYILGLSTDQEPLSSRINKRDFHSMFSPAQYLGYPLLPLGKSR